MKRSRTYCLRKCCGSGCGSPGWVGLCPRSSSRGLKEDSVTPNHSLFPMVFDVQDFVGAMPFANRCPRCGGPACGLYSRSTSVFLGREEYLRAFRKVTE